jgi:hypothetical protein
MGDSEIDLLAIKRGAITAPAGCGKTHLIAEALLRHNGSKPILVLTHTNSGLAALRGRLDRAGVSRPRYRLATIDGWAMRLISTFPMRSGHDPAILRLENRNSDYLSIRRAAVGLLRAGHVSDILKASYDRLFVDEYQDCSDVQHALLSQASRVFPTCVLGDPMQAIFGFKGNRLVDWNSDVQGFFGIAGQLRIPHRWINAGEKKFGCWLLAARQQLLEGKSVCLSSAPSNVRHIALDGASDYTRRLVACRTRPPTTDGRVLIIADSRRTSEHRQYASQTPGAVTVENVDLTDLVSFADRFDLQNPEALKSVVEFAATLMTNVGPNDLLARVATLKAGRARRRSVSEAEVAALAFAASPSYAGASELLATISKEGGVRTHRPAILKGCHKMFQLCAATSDLSPHEAAVQVREQARLIGRPLAKRTVGSTLLLKGLEADVAVILYPEEMDTQHLYVAMTRGARSLVVCSSSRKLLAKPTRS